MMQIQKTIRLVVSLYFATALGLLVMDSATADDKPVGEDEPNVEVGTVTGRISLPDEIPDWFRGGEL